MIHVKIIICSSKKEYARLVGEKGPQEDLVYNTDMIYNAENDESECKKDRLTGEEGIKDQTDERKKGPLHIALFTSLF